MHIKKPSLIPITILMMFLSLLFSGCYTQLSRPDVDTEYYPQDDEEYTSEYSSEEEVADINYYDIYISGGNPIYYGPHVWTYWSPYYRWHGYGSFYDPWQTGYDYWGYNSYAPFWDPWFDDWWHYNYYHYNPNHYYYWTYEGGHNSWHAKAKGKRDFGRGGYDPGEERYRSKRNTPPPHKKIVDQVEKYIPRDRDSKEVISIPNRPTVKRDAAKKDKPIREITTTPKQRNPKQSSKPVLVTEPTANNPDSRSKTKSPDTYKPKQKPTKSRINKPSKGKTSRDHVKKSSPPKSSKSSRVKSAPSKRRPSVKSAPAKRRPSVKSAPAKSRNVESKKSSGSKNSEKKKK